MSGIDLNSADASADEIINSCLLGNPPKSFFLYAGAGSGKTRSLVSALVALREQRGPQLWMRGQRIGVITILGRLGAHQTIAVASLRRKYDVVVRVWPIKRPNEAVSGLHRNNVIGSVDESGRIPPTMRASALHKTRA